MRLDDVRGFVFDIDGTLVHRDGRRRCTSIPGARRGARPGRAPPAGRTRSSRTAATWRRPRSRGELRAAGLPVEDEQVLTPLCSVQAYLDRFRGERARPAVRDRAGARVPRRRPASTSSTAQRRARRRRLRRAHRRDRLRRARARRARRHRRRAPAHRQLRPGLRRRERPDPEPRRDGHRRDREGEQRPAGRRRQAVAGGGARDGAAARRAVARRSPSSATTSASTSRSAASAARRRCSSAAGSAASLDLDASFPRRAGPTVTIDTVAELLAWL